jgi:hypothetical protein
MKHTEAAFPLVIMTLLASVIPSLEATVKDLSDRVNKLTEEQQVREDPLNELENKMHEKLFRLAVMNNSEISQRKLWSSGLAMTEKRGLLGRFLATSHQTRFQHE